MTTPRQPPTPARVESATATPGRPEDKPRVAAAPNQSETEKARTTGHDAVNAKLERNWKEEDIINSIRNGDHFQSNLANRFNNLAYHWRLFVMGPRNFLYETEGEQGAPKNILDFYERIDGYRQVNIAESAVTGFDICDVEIEQAFSDASARSAVTTGISFRVVEPNGVQFLDSLVQATKEVEIQNYADFYYYLELTFTGYETDGSINTSPFAELPNGGRWIWAIHIADLEVNLGTGGGQYRVRAIPIDQRGLSPNSEYGQLLDATMIRAETIGEFFKELGEKLNRSWMNRLQAPTTTHKFEFHGMPATTDPEPKSEERKSQPKPANWSKDNWSAMEKLMAQPLPGETRPMGAITPEAVAGMTLRPEIGDWNSLRGSAMVFIRPTTDEENAKGSLQSADNTGNTANAPTAHLPAGTTIESVISAVFSSCERAQCLARDSSANVFGPDDSDDAINDHGYRESLIWRVIPEIKILGKFDSLSGRYYREIIWHIYPRVSQEPILSMSQVYQAREPSVQRGMLAALAARGFLPKRYDYLFTGRNTEVTNFDLNFNLAWQAQLPPFANYRNDQNLDHARHNKDREEKWGDPAGKLSASYGDFNSKRQDFREHMVDAKKDGEFDRDESKEGKRLLTEMQSAADTVVRDRERLKAARARADKLFQPVSVEQDYSRAYVEALMDAGAIKEGGSIGALPPVMVSQTGGQEAKQETGNGMAGQYHAGKTLYGSILNQLYGGPSTSKFQEITMTIRGDPFWLPHGSFELALLHHPEADTAGSEHVLFGTPAILFAFKYPVDVGDDGQIELRAGDTVTGIYNINVVKTKFTGGKFEHELQGNRLPLIDINVATSPIDTPKDSEGE